MVSVDNTSRSKRSLDMEINLVPFIDLLSMCICFLLMTAVWVQMQVVQVKQAQGTEAAKPTGLYDLRLDFTSATSLDLTIEKDGKALKKIPLGGPSREALLADLDQVLTKITSEPVPEGTTVVNAAMITPDAKAPYGNMVSVMDLLRQHQIVNMGVVPKKG